MKKAQSKYSSKTPTEKEYDLYTPSKKKDVIKVTPKETDSPLFSASIDEVNKRMKKEKKLEETQDKQWGDPSKVFLPSSPKKTKAASVVKKIDDKVPENIKELILLIYDLRCGLGTKDESWLKTLKKRSEKVLKQYGMPY